jgi:hypothetical protein
MLENLAIKLITESEDTLTYIGFGVWLIGFTIALVAQSKAKGELQRAPYFALFALIFLVSIMFEFIWLFSVPAIRFGFLWVIVGVAILGVGIIGYFFGVITVARSRDAFGMGRYAILAVIPFVNLVLLFKASKTEFSSNRIPTIPLITGGKGVVAGFLMLVAAVFLSVTFEMQAQRMAHSVEPEAGIEFMLRSQGLEQTLKAMTAHTEELPIIIDRVTKLVSVEADGSHLRRTYTIYLNEAFINDQMRAGIDQTICANGPLVLLLREGASIDEIFIKQDGSPIGRYTVTQENCGL